MALVSLATYPMNQKKLISIIYNGFVNNYYINKTYITIDECAQALIKGCHYHRGEKSLEPFLHKTIKKMEKPHARTHIGTFAYLKAVTEKKVEAAIVEARKRYVAASTAERVEFETKLASLKADLTMYMAQLSMCNADAIGVNGKMNDLTVQIQATNRKIDGIDKHLQSLTTQIRRSQQDIEEQGIVAERQLALISATINESRKFNEQLDRLLSRSSQQEEQIRQTRVIYAEIIRLQGDVEWLCQHI
ncbi:MAG: hypothetical protein KBA81_01585 [Rhabdochlamydiaceae bacterium]|nr:hypothetical protein [Rhabdochlamydiaceae bacterium]